MGVKGNDLDIVQYSCPFDEIGLGFRRHERTQHDQRGIRLLAIYLIGTDHPIDHHFTIATAAGGDQDIGTVNLCRLGQVAIAGNLPPQIPGIGHFAAHGIRHIDSRQRIMNLRQAIDPDRIKQVLQGGHDILAFPFRFQQVRVIHYIAQPKDRRHPPIPHNMQRLFHLSPQAQRFLVDDKQVGIEHAGRVADDGFPQRQSIFNVDMQLQRGVVAIAQLDHTRNPHKINAAAKIKAADDR